MRIFFCTTTANSSSTNTTATYYDEKDDEEDDEIINELECFFFNVYHFAPGFVVVVPVIKSEAGT